MGIVYGLAVFFLINALLWTALIALAVWLNRRAQREVERQKMAR